MNVPFITEIIFHPHVLKLFFLTTSGLLIRQSLVVIGQRWANTFHHLGTYLLLPSIAMIITSVIKDDIALSLGMIGALSIVRFRNPVKSPFELVMFFALLTLGIVCSVSLKLSILFTLLIIVVIFGIKIAEVVLKKINIDIYQYSFGDGNLNYTLEINSKEKLEDLLSEHQVINFFHDEENKIFNYRIIFKSKTDLLEFEKNIKKNKNLINTRADIQS
tara:strand:+ start:312 stop:965 length:654 start_codon:yes stop_codon:yes gene_type:complete